MLIEETYSKNGFVTVSFTASNPEQVWALSTLKQFAKHYGIDYICNTFNRLNQHGTWYSDYNRFCAQSEAQEDNMEGTVFVINQGDFTCFDDVIQESKYDLTPSAGDYIRLYGMVYLGSIENDPTFKPTR